ncbi:jg1572 [Pararge aegeria aegeria]|uniref:Jg1572 protein n=1 Tax=Pararge aegeria aegeria TaxID=348720 RepID=A0A8S4REF6_9NEOP|nr:jg1572 [Pararge aegeria aegeria]
MSYNKYNSRNSGRFNTTGQFVAAGDHTAEPTDPWHWPYKVASHSLIAPKPFVPLPISYKMRVQHFTISYDMWRPPRHCLYCTLPESYGGSPAQPRTLQPVQYNKPQIPVVNNSPAQNYSTFQSPSPAPPPPPPKTAVSPAATDVDMKVEQSDSAEDNRPPWMKARLLGVKKISNKERRRRQNENLRKLLTPKSALMVLNEIMPKEQVSNQFHVENVGHSGHQYYRTNAAQSFCADLTLDGNSYKGYGETKLTARNAAAEQAVRDLILRKMARVLLPEPAEPAEPGEHTRLHSRQPPTVLS